MTPSEWPLRFMPQRSAPAWRALIVCAAALALGCLVRGLALGFDNAAGLSPTYFPAFIVATLYGGSRWGWATLIAGLLLGTFGVSNTRAGVSRDAILAIYALSGAITVIVAAALREALLRLDEAKAAQAKAQADIAASEARFRTLADSAPVLMWVSRIGGRREFVNRAYVDYLGQPFEQALVFDWRQRIHPDDLDRVLREQAAGEAARKPFTLECRYGRRDGEYRWIHSVSQPRFSPEGAFEGFIGVGYDVTEARQAQADLTRINDLLAERVQAALAERDLAEAALRRAQKLEAVGQLTGGVAHDFNNLLTVIMGALDLMQRHPDDAARRDRMIDAALGAARRGERLNQQLLAFSRRQALKPELVTIDTLLADSEPLLRRAVGEAVSLSVSPAAPGAVANVDPSQFEAAVMNLVVNARDATPPGGTIRVESLRCALTPGQADDAPAGDYLCVAVHDTGQGMDAEVANRVFEPFFTTKAPGRGTGLGLSQVYGFARQSGGTVLIETAPGKGASVRVYLPLSREAAAIAPQAALPSEGEAPGRRVLLVEDDQSVGDVVEALLSELGHAVLRAANGAEATAFLRRGDAFDLMLTDVIMPGGMSGVELAHQAVALRPNLPIILSSGYTGETLGPATDAPWPLLRKPYDIETLAKAIAALLEGAPDLAQL